MRKNILKSLVVLVLALIRYFAIALKMNKSSLSNSPFFSPRVIAHRGGALEAPENTIYAFDHATSLGPSIMLELDVHLTLDKEVVVIHDGTLERTTNGKGLVTSHTLEELKTLDAAYHFKNSDGEHSLRGKGITIPSLEEIIDRYPKTEIILELKNDNLELADQCAKLLLEKQAWEYITFYSQITKPLKYLRTKILKGSWGATPREVGFSFASSQLGLGSLDPSKANVYSVPESFKSVPIITPKFISHIHAQKKLIYVWTINEAPKMTQLIQLGVDGLITDRPSLLLELIKQDLSTNY